MESKTNTLLARRKIEVLLNQAPVAMSAGVVAALISTVSFWHTSERNIVAGWFILYTLIFPVRYLLITRFNLTPISNRNYSLALNSHLLFSTLAGLLWSALGIYLLSSLQAFDSFIILLMIGGLIAGAAATHSVILTAYFTFSVAVALPLIVFLFTSAEPGLNMFGLILGVFVIFLSFTAYRLNKLVGKSLSLQFDNLELLAELEKEKNQVNSLYKDLEIDLAKRKLAEEQLTREKEKAEQLAQSLLAISTLDGLTGIPNRRHFDSIIAREWNRASRTNTPLSLILCDIDHFKAYNDHYGHQKGDNVLVRIANLLQENARREGDLAARYGGEEFVVVLPATSVDNARMIAEQMHVAIEELSIPHKFSPSENIVTASFGVATLSPRPDQHLGELIAKADKAMYQAKQKGRNHVMVAADNTRKNPEKPE